MTRPLNRTRTSKSVRDSRPKPVSESERMVPCARSEHHGFHRGDEPCKYCEPPEIELPDESRRWLDYPGWGTP